MKKYSISALFITAVCFLMPGTLRSQSFDSLLNRLDSEFPQEKIYVQFDKSAYNPGETIWLKAYLFTGIFPSQVSKTIYAELIDDQGKLLGRKSAPVIMSGAAAAFDLPDKLSSNTVYVRVYTRWMLNFDSSFIYEKAIAILNSKAKETKPAAVQAFLQFFPEGGDLVLGVESRVAFKATDGHGLPIAIKGEVKNSKGEKLATFASVHDGMGMFRLQPAPGEQYSASWKDPAGKNHETKLPAAREDGVVLEANQLEKGIQFVIRRPIDKTNGYPYVYVVAQLQQQLLYRARAPLQGTNTISGLIPTENIPAGIVQVTVFTPNEKPLAERIVFVNHQDYYFITDLNSAVKGLEKRKKNVIQIDVPDTISCNLSVSVTDATINPPYPGETDIFSGLLLTSDIKGYVHNPGYYFSSDADSVSKQLDLVMMTNGWRRFRWEDLLAGKWPSIRYQPDHYLGIEGKVTGLTKSELLQRELTGFLVLKNGNQQLVNIPVQNDGTISLMGLVFYDTAKLYYQFNNDKNKVLTSKALIDFKTDLVVKPIPGLPDSNQAFTLYRPGAELLAKARQLFQKQQDLKADEEKRVKVLEAVTVVAKQKSKKEKINEEYTSGLFASDNGYTFITEDDPFANSSLSVLQYLQGKVAGLQITVQGSNATLSWRGGSPSLFLNEMPTDVSAIQSYPMSDVALIKVYRPPFFGAVGGGSGGAIAVYGKKGKAATNDVKGLDFANLHGYSGIKEFYSPDYSIPDSTNEAIDIRSTLYWNPYVFTDKDNKRIFLTFYNNDSCKKYRVVIEGINAEGRLTRIEKTFE